MSTSARSSEVRSARFRVPHVDVFSALYTSIIVSFSCFLGWVAAVYLVLEALSRTGMFESVTQSTSEILGASAPEVGPGEVYEFFTYEFLFSKLVMLGVILAIAFVLATLVFALVYNAAGYITGGLTITLEERPDHRPVGERDRGGRRRRYLRLPRQSAGEDLPEERSDKEVPEKGATDRKEPAPAA